MSDKSPNVHWHPGLIAVDERAGIYGHRGVVVWLTGLSGSGKSTVARKVEESLVRRGAFAYVLDGDNLRHGLNADLAFSSEDREENLRRTGEVARLFWDAGAIALCAFISPFRRDRDRLRHLLPVGAFLEVYVDTPLDVCEARDPKGLYRKARAGEIENFTGIHQAYEPPEHAEITLHTATQSIDDCAATVIADLESRGALGMRR